jgi:hypothetical protein
VCVGLDTATLSPPTLRNDAKFADTVYMADCISLTSRPKQVTIWDSWFGTGGDVADDARHAHFGGGRSLVRYNPSDKLLYRIASNGSGTRRRGNKRAVRPIPLYAPSPANLGSQATKLVSAIQKLEGSMRRAMSKGN